MQESHLSQQRRFHRSWGPYSKDGDVQAKGSEQDCFAMCRDETGDVETSRSRCRCR